MNLNPMQLLQMLPALKSNPIGFLQQRGFNVPNNLSDPNQIVQYLMNSGQINQNQYNQARSMAQSFGMK